LLFVGCIWVVKVRVISVESSIGSAQPLITQSSLKIIKTNIPPLPTQQHIADILGSLDDKIELNRQMNATLEEMARAIFKSWFVDFDPVYAKMEGRDYPLPAEIMDLFPDALEESELGLIPKGWRVGKLGDMIEIHDSKRIPLSRKQREKRHGKYPYYGATKIMDYVNDYLFDGKYVLMGEDGSVITEEGYPFLQYVWGKFWANNHAHVLTGKNGFSSEYLYILMQKTNIQPYITGAVQLKLNQKNMKSIPMVIPNNKVVDKFDGIIQPFFSKIRNNSNQIEMLVKTRDSLLPKLMNGEIKV
jgi:type I restriction enzyme S subunit